MNKLKFKLSYMIKRPEIIRAYKLLQKTKSLNVDELNAYQNDKLRKIILHAYNNVPYYSRLFNSLKIHPRDIQTQADLEKLPILTKEDIKKDPDSFIAKGYKGKIVKGSTGGSTGKPLRYIMSDEDYSMGAALLLRGYEFAGYKLGDPLVMIAGASLVSNKQSLKGKIQDWGVNYKGSLLMVCQKRIVADISKI